MITSTAFALPVILAQEEVATAEPVEALAYLLLFGILISWMAGAIKKKEDKSFLPGLIMWGFAAKMVGALARFWMVTDLYGDGDSFTYHSIGRIMANSWRVFEVPVSDSSQVGTAATEIITGFLYAPYAPSMLGGFIIFASVAFLGQVLFYCAARPWLNGYQLKVYAMAVFFVPSLVFWPSSIGKDALMMFFLGLAAYGASRLLRYYRFSSLLYVAPGLYLASQIRSHVAAVMGLAIVLAAILGKPPKEYRSSPKRAIMILVAAAGAALSIAAFSATFGVSVDGGNETQSPDAFLADVSERTATGGSEVQGAAVSNPIQLPGATIKVLFRPLIYEASSMQVMASALEGTALLAIVIWKFPAMWRRKSLLREKPMLLMALLYTGGFVVGFSAILNLGILARQRIQVLPLFLLLIVGLGWDEKQPRRGPPRPKRELEEPESADVVAEPQETDAT